MTTALARLTAEVEAVADADVDATVVVDNLTGRTIAARSKVRLAKGVNRVPLDFVIRRPALWWPNGLGAHPLYSFRARLLINGRRRGRGAHAHGPALA